jgi:hypothetical protein
MRIRFQADADLDGRILKGFKRRAPEIDFRAAAGFIGVPDPDVLRIAAETGRILVSQDRRTMPGHFARYAAVESSPGIILVREATPILAAVEDLLLMWTASEAEEWINRLVWIPLGARVRPSLQSRVCAQSK